MNTQKIVIQQYLQKISEQYPDFSYKTYTTHTDGYDHNVLMFDNNTVFRFVKGGYAKDLKKYKKSLLVEKTLLEHLHKKTTVQLPLIEDISQDGSFSVCKKVSGKESKAWRYTQLSQKNKQKLAKQLAEFLTAVHTLQKKSIKKLEEPSSVTQFSKEVKKYIFPKLKKTEQQHVVNFLKQLSAAEKFSFDKPVLTHGDLHNGHLFLSEDKSLLGVIDFTDRAVQDPASDFAALWNYGPKFVSSVYEQYQGPKDETFLERSTLYHNRVALYMMRDAIKYKLGNFEKGYNMFKKWK